MKTKTKSKIGNKFFAIILIIILVYLGYRYFFKQKEAEVFQLSGEANDLINLALEPGFLVKPANTKTAIALNIDTGNNSVSSVRVELAFSPEKCTNPVVTRGDFLPRTVSPLQVANGLIKFTYAVPANADGKQGNGTLITIKTGPTNGNCTLAFTDNTYVTAVGVVGNALGWATPSTIKLEGQDSTTPAFKQPQNHPDTLSR